MTAQRYLDLHDVGGADDYFSSDLADDEMRARALPPSAQRGAWAASSCSRSQRRRRVRAEERGQAEARGKDLRRLRGGQRGARRRPRRRRRAAKVTSAGAVQMRRSSRPASRF